MVYGPQLNAGNFAVAGRVGGAKGLQLGFCLTTLGHFRIIGLDLIAVCAESVPTSTSVGPSA